LFRPLKSDLKLGLNDIQAVYRDGFLSEICKIARFCLTSLDLNEIKVKFFRLKIISEFTFGLNKPSVLLHGTLSIKKCWPKYEITVPSACNISYEKLDKFEFFINR